MSKKKRKKVGRKKKQNKEGRKIRKSNNSIHKGYSSDSLESTSDDNNDSNVKRSAISGKKIMMHIEKTEDDLVREKARKELLKFMNSSLK